MRKQMETVDLIASGYEFVCPYCDALNKLIEVPSDLIVRCKKCGKRANVSDYHHAEQ